MKETIRKINSLHETIQVLESFLHVLNKSDIESPFSNERSHKRNTFVSLQVESRIFTGDEAVGYIRMIRDEETINLLSKLMKPMLESRIEEKRSELKSLINENC